VSGPYASRDGNGLRLAGDRRADNSLPAPPERPAVNKWTFISGDRTDGHDDGRKDLTAARHISPFVDARRRMSARRHSNMRSITST